MKARADFSIQVRSELKHIHIIDQNLGNMSVTNDVENVLAEISHTLGHSLAGWHITYLDSAGDTDRILVDEHGKFSGFQPGGYTTLVNPDEN